MSGVFFSGVAVDQNIINVHGAKNVQVVSQSVIDVVLKCHGFQSEDTYFWVTLGVKRVPGLVLS